MQTPYILVSTVFVRRSCCSTCIYDRHLKSIVALLLVFSRKNYLRDILLNVEFPSKIFSVSFSFVRDIL